MRGKLQLCLSTAEKSRKMKMMVTLLTTDMLINNLSIALDDVVSADGNQIW